jgi:high-affinity iron transporter
VFGIPADPRLVEVLGWLLYAVPVLVVFLWPARLAAAPRIRSRLLAAASAVLLIVAAVLAIVAPSDSPAPEARTRTATDRAGNVARVSLAFGQPGSTLAVTPEGTANVRSIPLTAVGDQTVDGVWVREWQATVTPEGGAAPTVTLEQLLSMTGGRLPVGVSAARTPGPFQARWTTTTVYTVLAQGDLVVSAQAASNRTAVLTGGGLTAAKTVSVGGLPTDWSTASAEDRAAAAQIAASDRNRAEGQLWKVWLPLVLAGFALACGLGAIVAVRGDTRAEHERKTIESESHRPGKVPVP